MTGMKIAIIFMAIAVISVLSNAVHLSYEECEEKLKDCEITVGTKNEDGEWEEVKKMDQECLQEVALECPELKIEFGSFGQEKRMARNADHCSEFKKYEFCGYDLVCVEKILKNCQGINYNHLLSKLVQIFKEKAIEVIDEARDK